jgi:ATP-dependent RNA helicase RhlE
MVFKSLSPALQQAVQEAGFTTSTPIQEQVIPLIMRGKDVMAQAQTGSGKSAAFVLPILSYLEAIPKRERQRFVCWCWRRLGN